MDGPDGRREEQALDLVGPLARGQTELPAWKRERNSSHRKVRARAPSRLPPKGDAVHTVMIGIAGLHNLALTG
ncbi:hypothetical protein [Streptomyces decoyicus]|uniref:hypothetical protein n=1 Tax=Streptomyces decoyicus TaxID=249567 RepID=UPI00363AEDCB